MARVRAGSLSERTMGQREERRRSRRFDWAWPISVTSSDREVAKGRTTNISRGGAYFHSNPSSPLRPGMIVDVCIDVPPAAEASAGKPASAKAGRAKTIEGRARVVRLDENPGHCGVALHFTEELDALPDAPSAPGSC